jgi:hypothetical protein
MPKNTQPVSIGRIVHYGSAMAGSKAAIITGLHQLEGGAIDNDTVALTVFDVNGSFTAPAVKFDSDGGACTWRWPPRV